MSAFDGDRIILRDLWFFGYHGVFAEEARLGQRFVIDLEVGSDLREVGETDDLNRGISYADIYEVVKAAFDSPRRQLIEAVAQGVCTALFERFAAIDWIVIRLRKPEAPIAMVRGEAAVELHRRRPS